MYRHWLQSAENQAERSPYKISVVKTSYSVQVLSSLGRGAAAEVTHDEIAIASNDPITPLIAIVEARARARLE